jgi:poly(beta-D-mannuronate) C5 epimerase
MLTLLTVVIGAFGLLASLSAGINTGRLANFYVVPRGAFVAASDPLVLAQRGLPPNSSIANVLSASPAIRAITVRPRVIVLTAGGKTLRTIPTPKPVTTISELTRFVNNPSWISETADGSVTLNVALVTEHGVNLTIGAPDVHTVRLLDAPSVLIGTDGGELNFSTVTVEAMPSPAPSDGSYKPFVAGTADAVLNVTDSTFSGLGWDHDASYGASWESGSTGRVVGSTFENGFIGVYTGEARNILFRDDVFRGNALYGLDPHTYSHGLVIDDVVAEDNRGHGIIFSVHVTDSVISDSISRDNGENGIMMDLFSSHNRILDNTVAGNSGDGLVTTDSPYNVFVGNYVSGNRVGVRLSAEDEQHTMLAFNRVIDNSLAGQNAELNGSNTTADNGGQWDEPVIMIVWSTVASVILLTAISLAVADWRRQNRREPQFVLTT